MVKIIDIDKLFDKYIEGYVYRNIGKIKPEEIENQIPVLYDMFGNDKIKELDDKTPNEYYKEYSIDELLDCLNEHIEKDVSVSDFLCEAITSKKDQFDRVLERLKKDNSEQFTLYLMNMIEETGTTPPVKKYLEFILWDYPESISELATECLDNYADMVKDEILAQFSECNEKKREQLTDILSNCKQKDDKIFDILIAEFAKRQDNIPLFCAFISKYGDDRALPFLMTAIESDKINYADFEELRFAIEALGGRYDKERDFSKDKMFKKIKGEKSK